MLDWMKGIHEQQFSSFPHTSLYCICIYLLCISLEFVCTLHNVSGIWAGPHSFMMLLLTNDL